MPSRSAAHLSYPPQALRQLALHAGKGGAAPAPLPAGCCPGDLAEILEFLQVRYYPVPCCFLLVSPVSSDIVGV